MRKTLGFIINNNSKIQYLIRRRQTYLRYALILYNRIKRRRMFLFLKKIKEKYERHRIWTKVKLSTFWEMDVPQFDDEQFKNKFGINKSTFAYLVRSLQNVRKRDTYWRYAIPLEKRIALAVYALGSSSGYRHIASLFGVGRTTAGEIVVDVCKAICKCLKHASVERVVQNDINEINARFRRLRVIKTHAKNMNVIIEAVQILNNICNKNNDYTEQIWMNESSSENLEVGGRCGIATQNAINSTFISNGI